MKDDRSRAENFLDARGVFPGDLHDHVHEFRATKLLAHQRPHAEVFGLLFRVFYGDSFRQRHEVATSSGFSGGFFRQAVADAVAEGFAVDGFSFQARAGGFHYRAHLF